jgi:HrpA-like RNA helicase
MVEKWLVFHWIPSLIFQLKDSHLFRFFFSRLSRCLLASSNLNCLEEMLKLVSIMSVETIFLTSSNLNEKMKMQRQKFTMNEGDHLTLLNVYKSFIANKKNKVIPCLCYSFMDFMYRNGVK